VAVGAKAGEEKGTVRVVDDGPGLPPERLAHPARPLEQPREGHAGLGLSVAWRLARRAGGELTVKNQEKGTGAVVELVLPSAAAGGGAS
jgi:C4-dicarboxylate-specific signal transduction histidine kinase